MMPPTKQSTFEVHVSKQIASSVSSIALGLMNAKVYHRGVDRIRAKKGFSFWSIGEFIEVHVTRAGTDSSKISIMSKSVGSTTLIDWGVNSQNIERFEQLVRQLLETQKA